MITKPTVFVLGAGASHPYEFPLGEQLVKKIVDGLKERNFSQEVAAAAGGPDLVKSFADNLGASGRPSIDAFLETRREFLGIGKAAIARVLTEYEVDHHVSTNRPTEGWYHYLFNEMLTRTADRFLDNRLTIVTFNFDRSFERALVLSLQANYALSEHDAAQLAQGIPVHHVHGQLGELWATDDHTTRPYRPLPPDPVARRIELQKAARQIRIVHEEVEGSTLKAAQVALSKAEVICFLGFGYHATNVERLQCAKYGAPHKTLLGTRYRMHRGEWNKANRMFTQLQAEDLTVLQFLQTTDVIHG
jgi:hypothetical protein